MFIPIHDENPRRSIPIVSIALVAATVFAWVFVQGMGSGIAFAYSICDLSIIPGELTGRAVGEVTPLGHGLACVVDADPAWHTLLTAMFMHGDWFHLVGNLWFLWLFGDNVEEALGRVRYIAFYFACGLAASGVQIAIDPASPVPMVGASGAISGVMGAYVVLFPHVPVRVLTLLFVFVTIVRVPALIMLGYWFALQLLGGLPQLGLGTRTGVAFWAHIGGFLTGAGLALVVRRLHAARAV